MTSPLHASTAIGSDTRRRLIECGLRLFAEHGFKGVSVRDISNLAGVNVASINYHFGTKLGLYRAIFETLLDEGEPLFRSRLDTVDQLLAGNAAAEPEQLRLAVEHYAAAMLNQLFDNELMQWSSVLVARELAFPSELFELIYQRRAHPSQALLLRIVAAATGADPGSPDSRITAHMLEGLISNLIISRPILWRRMGWSDFSPEHLESLQQVIVDLIWRVLGLAK